MLTINVEGKSVCHDCHLTDLLYKRFGPLCLHLELQRPYLFAKTGGFTPVCEHHPQR